MALPQTKIVEVLKTSTFKTVKALSDKIGRALGSPINGKNVGEKFQITLTGDIEIREFQGQKSAYFKTKEGYNIKVNASFSPDLHKEGAIFTCICREFTNAEGTTMKFPAFVD